MLPPLTLLLANISGHYCFSSVYGIWLFQISSPSCYSYFAFLSVYACTGTTLLHHLRRIRLLFLNRNTTTSTYSFAKWFWLWPKLAIFLNHVWSRWNRFLLLVSWELQDLLLYELQYLLHIMFSFVLIVSRRHYVFLTYFCFFYDIWINLARTADSLSAASCVDSCPHTKQQHQVLWCVASFVSFEASLSVYCVQSIRHLLIVLATACIVLLLVLLLSLSC